MKNLLRTALFALLPSLTMAQECDCTITPFKPPPCFDKCTAKILGEADYKQLTAIFKIPRLLSQKIVAFPDRSKATSLEAYKKVLNTDEFSTVKTTFGNLTHEQLGSFYKSQEKSARSSNPP